MKKLLQYFPAALVMLAIAGCVSYSPVYTPEGDVKPNMAYLVGIYNDASAKSSRTLGITYENADNLTQHTFAFNKAEQIGQILVIEVPPGTYRAKSWFMASFTNEVMIRRDFTSESFLRTFKVEPGQAYFTGEYTGSGTVTQSGNMIYRNAQMRLVRPIPTTADRDALITKYPKLGKLPLKAAYF
jgi:hypothetical protein